MAVCGTAEISHLSPLWGFEVHRLLLRSPNGEKMHLLPMRTHTPASGLVQLLALMCTTLFCLQHLAQRGVRLQAQAL